MGTDKVFGMNRSMTEKWGQIMDSRVFDIRIGICLMLALIPGVAALADTEVTAASYMAGSNGDITITLTTSGDTPSVSVFATESPARIILDLAETDSMVDSSPVSVGMGAVQSFTTLAAGGRTRVLVDLSRSVSYDYSADAGQVVLTIAGGASFASSGSQFRVENVDFRRGEDGQSQVIVSLNREGANIAVTMDTGQLAVDIFNTDLPDSLNQRLDVVDFATPVQIIDASQRGNGVRLNLSVTANLNISPTNPAQM